MRFSDAVTGTPFETIVARSWADSVRPDGFIEVGQALVVIEFVAKGEAAWRLLLGIAAA